MLATNVQVTSNSHATVTLQQYLTLPYEGIKTNPLEFWKKNSTISKHLARLEIKYACILATSVPSERIFSKTGEIMSALWNRLLPDNLEKLIVLNKNM